MTRRPYITYAIIALNCLLFAGMMLYDSALSYPTMVDFGAKVNFRIADWQLLNLIMPMFLHASVSHLGFNSLALYYFGPTIERMLGPVRYTISYLLVGLLATMGSFVFSTHVSLGASGVIYGFMALHLYLYLRNRQAYLQVFQSSIIELILFNLAISFIVPNIDIAGHLVGFAAGLAVFPLVLNHRKKWFIAPLSAVLLLTIVGVFIWHVPHYRHSENYYITKGAYLYQKGEIEALQQLNKHYLDAFPGSRQ